MLLVRDAGALFRSGLRIDNVEPFLQVQAHGGGLLKVKNTWYWFGESYKRPLLGDFLSEGVNLYSSTGEGPIMHLSCSEAGPC